MAYKLYAFSEDSLPKIFFTAVDNNEQTIYLDTADKSIWPESFTPSDIETAVDRFVSRSFTFSKGRPTETIMGHAQAPDYARAHASRRMYETNINVANPSDSSFHTLMEAGDTDYQLNSLVYCVAHNVLRDISTKIGGPVVLELQDENKWAVLTINSDGTAVCHDNVTLAMDKVITGLPEETLVRFSRIEAIRVTLFDDCFIINNTISYSPENMLGRSRYYVGRIDVWLKSDAGKKWLIDVWNHPALPSPDTITFCYSAGDIVAMYGNVKECVCGEVTYATGTMWRFETGVSLALSCTSGKLKAELRTTIATEIEFA